MAENDKKFQMYWCGKCNIPIYSNKCSICNSEANYVGTDMRPVFPEEKLLLAIITNKDNLFYYNNDSVWHNGYCYIVNGEKLNISIQDLNNRDLDDIKEIKILYDENKEKIDYAYFNIMIRDFIKANLDRYNEITTEAFDYVLEYKDKYDINEMFVSFSGGKDSTVTSDVVTKALGTKKILHIFGDTTLEFPLTYDYVKRFRRDEKNIGLLMLTSKNRDKNFFELCDEIGPPARLMRWCCTVFKTGSIQKKITDVFKDKTKIITFYGIRHSESASRSKYDRESDSPKITKQVVVSPIIEWKDIDVWLYIFSTGIDFNDAYRLGYSRVGCWCCPNNGYWSEFLSKVYMYDEYKKWYDFLVSFAKRLKKPDPEEYIKSGNWKARQGGQGLEIANTSRIKYESCATKEDTFNYKLQVPISDELYELFKPFGYLNFSLGRKRLGEVYVLDKRDNILLVLSGRKGSNDLKVTIKNKNIAGSKTIDRAEKKIQCQLTKYQMCKGCKACESICKHNAIKITYENNNRKYTIDSDKCIRCGECIGHFTGGCYMRKVLTIKR